MKLHELPERTRKIILWTTVIVLGVVLFAWWARSLPERLGTIQQEGLGIEFPEINNPLDFPEIPDINIKDLSAVESTGEEHKEIILEENGEGQEQ